MKPYSLILLIMLAGIASAQTTRFIDTYQKERGTFKTLNIPMSFDSDSITKTKPGITIGQVYRIDYVASSFSTKIDSYQKSLDEKRWNRLFDFTGIDKTQVGECNVFYQTSATTEEEATKLFHGFIVYFDESMEVVLGRSSTSFSGLISTIADRTVNATTESISLTKPKIVDTLTVGNITSQQKATYTKELSVDNVIVQWDYDSIGRDKKYYNARYVLTKVGAGVFTAYNALSDLSVIEMLRRIKMDKNTLIVTDLTGSMYPYYSQLVLWHTLRMNTTKKEHYVFFNDGNEMSDESKKIGSTGGVYSAKTNDILTLFRTMETCMSAGGGGDTPENNFEAVLNGIEKYDSITKVILICDNFAVPRDTSLLKNITVPIEFVMCGASLGINTTYLNLARDSKNKIHTMQKSFDNLHLKKNGDKFSIGTRTFIIYKNKVTEFR
ncbi:MAG: hypothetical protein IPM74_14685 [Crocinitomicaceae bacterium]|nr:hypothetical protein [Crocinitomicaceae bacterium]MBK8927117.1 hypothetical protein [Crocinitomicaceae bacterium]